MYIHIHSRRPTCESSSHRVRNNSKSVRWSAVCALNMRVCLCHLNIHMFISFSPIDFFYLKFYCYPYMRSSYCFISFSSIFLFLFLPCFDLSISSLFLSFANAARLHLLFLLTVLSSVRINQKENCHAFIYSKYGNTFFSFILRAFQASFCEFCFCFSAIDDGQLGKTKNFGNFFALITINDVKG